MAAMTSGISRRIGMALLLSAAFSGCATPRKAAPASPVTPPENWKATAMKSPLAPSGWLPTFHDPRLEAVVGEAEAGNDDLKAAAARLRGAMAQSRVTAADLYPQLDLHGGASANDSPLYNGNSLRYQLSPGNWNYTVNLALSWEVDVWGRLRSQTQAAKADAASALFSYEGARLSLAGQTAKAWFAVLESRDQVRIAEQTQASFKKTLTLTESRHLNGAVSSFDVHLTSAQEQASEADLVQRRENFSEAKRSLEILLGRYPSAGMDIEHAQLPPLVPAVPAGIPSERLLRRPDLKAADWTLFASENRVFSANAERLPRLALTSTAGTPSVLLQNITNDQNFLYTVAANLTQPILDGGRITWNIRVNKSARDAAAATYAQQVLTAFRDVENALSNEAALASEQQIQERALQDLREAYRVANVRYKSGQIDIVSLLQTQNSMLASESTLLHTRLLRLKNRIDLFLALGESPGPCKAVGFRDPVLKLPMPGASGACPRTASPADRGVRVPKPGGPFCG